MHARTHGRTHAHIHIILCLTKFKYKVLLIIDTINKNERKFNVTNYIWNVEQMNNKNKNKKIV